MALRDRLSVRENEPQRPCGYFWEGVNRMFDMTRRQFITLLGGAAVAPPFLGPVARWLASKAPGRRL
jgi:hypothetical protein